MIINLKKALAIAGPVLFVVISIILGIVSPGYSIEKHTLSRLLIHKYGYLQLMNFIQFGISLLVSGNIISGTLKDQVSRKSVRTAFNSSALLAFLVAVFTPTDIDKSVLFYGNFNEIGWSAFAHVLVVVTFVVISPIFILSIANSFNRNSDEKLARITILMGFASFFASLFWIFCYYKGWLWEYKGILQKVLALWTIIWIEIVTIKSLRKKLIALKSTKT